MHYRLTVTPGYAAVGESFQVVLTAPPRGPAAGSFPWWVAHEGECLVRGTCLGRPVRVLFERPGRKVLHAMADRNGDGPRPLARAECLVEDELGREIDFLLHNQAADPCGWFREVCERAPMDAARRSDLDGRLSAHLRAAADLGVRGRAFVLLVQLHRRAAEIMARRMGFARTALEDVLQEGAKRAFRSLDQFRQDPEGRRFGPWFYGIAHNVAIDLRYRGGDGPHGPLPDPDSTPGPGDAPDRRLEQSDLVAWLLGLLDPTQRQLLQLRILDGATYLEIADLLQIDVGQNENTRISTVRRAIVRALEFLKGKLNEL